MRVLSWNLYHGRDFPPALDLLGWRSRLLRTAERDATHAQLNRSLRAEFGGWLAVRDWDVALLQEAPPRWLRALAEGARASGVLALTSRNELPWLRGALADWNPDLMASAEGGSNQLLVRGRIAEVRRLTLARRPERRRLLWARVEVGGEAVCVANVHLSAGRPRAAADELLRAADAAVRWSGAAPLVLGGDLNLRVRDDPEPFDALRERYGLAGPTAPGAIDHLLARGLEVVDPPAALPTVAREVPDASGLRIRLSDHAPVTAAFRVR